MHSASTASIRENKTISKTLYNPSDIRDACGMAFIANIKGVASRDIVRHALQMPTNLEHRGAVGADPKAGDGAGVLTQIPRPFFRRVCEEDKISLPNNDESWALGYCFMPQCSKRQEQILHRLKKVIASCGHRFLGYRRVPVESNVLGHSVKEAEPAHIQIFISSGKDIPDNSAFEVQLFALRRHMENAIALYANETKDHVIERDFYIVSLSSRIVVYKGMILGKDLPNYYPDLKQDDYISALAIAHIRFSTNTLPSWRLAHPYRMLCHNGEINTVKGNVRAMKAREGSECSALFDQKAIKDLAPLVKEGQSDTASLDNMVDLLVHCGGYSLPHAMVTVMPPSWENDITLSQEMKAFYQYHAERAEPWDGPAAVISTDGIRLCASLDRNGLRPVRYWKMDNDMIVLSSEAGVVHFAQENILEKRRLNAGTILTIDTNKGLVIENASLKEELAKKIPYLKRIQKRHITFEKKDTQRKPPSQTESMESLRLKHQQMGYTLEDIKYTLQPMALEGAEPVGSMGDDTPKAILTRKTPLLYEFFRQRFAQVTNPAIDSIREASMMSLNTFIGPRGHILSPMEDPSTSCLYFSSPVLNDDHMAWIISHGAKKAQLPITTLSCSFRQENNRDLTSSLRQALDRLRDRAIDATLKKSGMIILSDCLISEEHHVPIPMLLALSCVHQGLVDAGLRTKTGIIVQTNEAKEIHHFCCLASYGAEAIYAPLAFATAKAIGEQHGLKAYQVATHYEKALNKGILKVMSKMGIATFASYCGSSLFDAVGLSSDLIETYFRDTHSPVGGINLKTLAQHAKSRWERATHKDALDDGGIYALRIGGEQHVWTPQSIQYLQHATRGGEKKAWDRFVESVDQEQMTLRSLLKITNTHHHKQKALPLEKVESSEKIIRRFSTGAMSFGSISREAHTTLAIAMNTLGGMSNTGEGGEEPGRFEKNDDGTSACSAIKQVASGRFGVTPHYLVNAQMIQIKIAQGAKPGEGGQLPGKKVDKTIARVRNSTPGVGLISPPPHHDIYSIEDLAQLIFDLKNVNPEASVSVKLVSERGVGTIAAGVAKAKADHITIAGADGGTGASPLNSIYHAGNPWEIGLAETHQTLLAEGLREQVALQVDGGIRTPHDVVKAALLGADGCAFSIAPLIATGCVMMRKCHLNTCPVGIATQNADLRAFYTGVPEDVIAYFTFLAEGIREIMAQMGIGTFKELIGQTQWLTPAHKHQGLDLEPLLYRSSGHGALHHHGLGHKRVEDVLDCSYLDAIEKSLERQECFEISEEICTENRSIGTRISGMIARKYGSIGLPDDRVSLRLKGCAGQSFGAFLSPGVSLSLDGEANDYVGKGMHGGRISIFPPKQSPSSHLDRQAIIGNTALYGATGGDAYFAGEAGDRFAVRNSGAITVVEGMGEHGCEYMTGGIVLCLDAHGRNTAAGMSGGIAYLLDEDGTHGSLCNQESVGISLLDMTTSTPTAIPPKTLRIMEKHLHYDNERILWLLRCHIRWTGSPKAQKILDGWEFWKKRFLKVLPHDYRRAILEIQEQKQEHQKHG